MFKVNKKTLTNVTFWGLTDDASWLNTFPVTRSNWPLLFDKNLQPKPAYWALVDDQVVTRWNGSIPKNRCYTRKLWCY